MGNVNKNAVMVVVAVWLLGIVIGGFFGFNDGKKWERSKVERELQKNICPFCGQQIPSGGK